MGDKGAYVVTENKSGTTVEKFSSKAMINNSSIASISFKVPDPTVIESKKVTNSRFADSPNRTWLTNISVTYPDGSSSTRAYIDGMVIDTKRFSESMDYFYLGIPKCVFKKIHEEAIKSVKMSASSTLADKNSSASYVWTTSKIERVKSIGIFARDGKNLAQRHSVKECILELKRHNINPILMGIAQLKMKCTCDKKLGHSDALELPWTMGATLQLAYIYGDTGETSPSSVPSDVESIIKVPKNVIVADSVGRLTDAKTISVE